MISYCSQEGATFCRRIKDRCADCPTRREAALIDEIFSVRVRNNIPWKRLIEIAMKHAPDETKAALRDINANDRAISDLMTELAK